MSGVKGKRIQWTPEMRTKAVALRGGGASLSAIGRAVGVSHTAVRSMLARELSTPFARAQNEALRRAYLPRSGRAVG